MPRSFASGEWFETVIDAQVAQGRYSDQSEVVRDALRLLEGHSQPDSAEWHRLGRLAEEGRLSGLADGADATLDQLVARYREMIHATDG